MSDIRKWRFTTGYGATSQISNVFTDFWGEWKASGDPAIISYQIHGQYDLASKLTGSTDAFEIRAIFEKRNKLLAKYKGRQGLLEVDFAMGGSRPETLADVVLDEISIGQGDNNLLLEIDMTFKYPMSGTLVRTISLIQVAAPTTADSARTWDSAIYYKFGDLVIYGGLVFNAIKQSLNQVPSVGIYWGLWINPNRGDWDPLLTYASGDIVTYTGVNWKAKQPNRNQAPALNAIWGVNGTVISGMDNSFYVVAFSRPDATLFKPVARGSTIRVQSAPAMQVMTLTGIRQKVRPMTDSDLARRQSSEALMERFVNYIGTEFVVLVDGVSKGQCHLADVKQGSIDLPDAVTFDLVFNRGYVNG